MYMQPERRYDVNKIAQNNLMYYRQLQTEEDCTCTICFRFKKDQRKKAHPHYTYTNRNKSQAKSHKQAMTTFTSVLLIIHVK